ncbi:MAG: DUF1573 domain-containing protein [Vicingaceae bacterium]
MNDNIKNGLLIVIAALTIVNTGILLSGGNDVSYEKTSINKKANSNAAANGNADINFEDNYNNNNEAQVVEKELGPKTNIQFTEMEHDFGKIEQNTRNPKTFTFTNTGENPLIISDAKGSCGCTVPQYPREPIAPGETGEIEVVYSPGSQKNKQTKTVTITANTEPATTVLRITADVNPGEGGDAPANPNGGQTIQLGS